MVFADELFEPELESDDFELDELSVVDEASDLVSLFDESDFDDPSDSVDDDSGFELESAARA